MRTPTQLTVPLVALALTACGGDSGPTLPETEERVTVFAASSVVLDDETNVGDASDFVVTWVGTSQPTNVVEYRVMLRDAAEASGFTLADANQIPSARYATSSAQLGDQSLELPAGLLDIAGNPVEAGREYIAYLLTVGVEDAVANAISQPSNAMALAETSIKVTYLGNAGVMVEDDEHRVLIDALTGNLNGWIPLATADLTKLTGAQSPFDGIDVAMTTHAHGDHFSPTAVNSFMSSNAAAEFLAPPQARSGLTFGARVPDVSPARGEMTTIESGGVTIDVLHLRHFDQFGNDFSGVQNYGYVVHLGGLKVLHVGDVHYSAENFEPFGLSDIDVVILPTFNTLLSASNASVIADHVAPEHVIALHFQVGLLSAQSQNAVSLFGATAFTTSLEFRRY